MDSDTDEKLCIKCETIKPLTEFYKHKTHKDGLRSECKVCSNKASIERSKKNPTYQKDRRKADIENARAKGKINYIKNREKILASARDSYKKNPKKYIKKALYYVQENRDKVNEQKRIRHKQRKENDLSYRIKVNLRSRLSKLVRDGQKSGSAVKDLGCSVDFFKKYLTALWKPGMDWDNYGTGKQKWNIDHIIPLSSFDLTNREEVLKACHHTNLQPMWAIENIKKGDKIL